MTENGPFYDKAMGHLKHLKLAEKAESDGLNKLGNNIRSYFRVTYNVDGH